jgi:tRNA-dihydrouridine synthase
MFLGPKSDEPQRLGQPKVHKPFFLDYAKAVRSHVPKNVPVIVTGGFRTCSSIKNAVANGDCDLVGLARPAIVNPLLPKTTVLSPTMQEEDVTLYAKKTEASWILKQTGIRAVEVHMDNVSEARLLVGVSMRVIKANNLQAWYVEHLKQLAQEEVYN